MSLPLYTGSQPTSSFVVHPQDDEERENREHLRL